MFQIALEVYRLLCSPCVCVGFCQIKSVIKIVGNGEAKSAEAALLVMKITEFEAMGFSLT